MPDFGSVFSLACLLALGLIGSGDGLFGSSFEPKRVKKRRVIIRGKDGREYLLQREEITCKDNVHGWVTVENVFPVILKNGTKITSHLELAGSCWYCNELVAIGDARVCDCGRLVCWEHSKYDEEQQKFFCTDCYKKLRRKRFLGFLLSPFIEKIGRGK
jgi:hypothetical protein